MSLSETSTKENNSNNYSVCKTRTLPINSTKKLSSTRFSRNLKSRYTNNRPKQNNKKVSKTILPKNNNHYYDKHKCLTLRKQNNIKLNDESHKKICQKCLNLIQSKSTLIKPNSFCQSCIYIIQELLKMTSVKKPYLNKSEENELRHIIEVILEEFQDHFGQALNLSMKQMTQHLLSNTNLFYKYYQKEFEQLTKKYRLEFLERFIQLMKKCQTKTNHINQKSKLSMIGRVIRFLSFFLLRLFQNFSMITSY